MSIMLSHFFAKQFNVIGIMGVVLVLGAYLLLQIDKLSQNSITYSLLNLIGSVLILISLLYTWNLASFVIEIAWLLISVFGLGKAIFFSLLED